MNEEDENQVEEVPEVEIIKIPFLLRVNDSIIDPQKILKPKGSEEELPLIENEETPLNNKNNEVHIEYLDAKIILNSNNSIDELTKKAVNTLKKITDIYNVPRNKEVQ